MTASTEEASVGMDPAGDVHLFFEMFVELSHLIHDVLSESQLSIRFGTGHECASLVIRKFLLSRDQSQLLFTVRIYAYSQYTILDRGFVSFYSYRVFSGLRNWCS